MLILGSTIRYNRSSITYTISNSLSDCTTNNASTTVNDGSSYIAQITPNQGYTLDGATVVVRMNGDNITSTVYNAANGFISIPKVTGDIVIIIAAALVGPSFTDSIYQLSSDITLSDSYDWDMEGNSGITGSFCTTIVYDVNLNQHVVKKEIGAVKIDSGSQVLFINENTRLSDVVWFNSQSDFNNFISSQSAHNRTCDISNLSQTSGKWIFVDSSVSPYQLVLYNCVPYIWFKDGLGNGWTSISEFKNWVSDSSEIISNSIILSSSTSFIGMQSFDGCLALTDITIRSESVPTLESANAFRDTNNCPIYVVASLLSDYQVAQNWSSLYSRLQEIPVTPTLDEYFITFSSPSNQFSLDVSTPQWDGSIEYSTDKEEWAIWGGESIESALNSTTNEYELYLRGINNTFISYAETSGVYGTFNINSLSPDICVRGNIETLLDYESVSQDLNPPVATSCFERMFYQSAYLYDVSQLKLKTEYLSESCYKEMFRKCNYLTYAPQIFATYASTSSLRRMFNNCSSLITIPQLVISYFNSKCCIEMFRGCSSLYLSDTEDSQYSNRYSIPYIDSGEVQILSEDWGTNMFQETGGSFQSTPEILTDYYTSNTVVSNQV